MARLVSILFAFAAMAMTPAALAASPSGMFMVRTTTKSVDEVVKAIEAYADKHEWFFMGEVCTKA